MTQKASARMCGLIFPILMFLSLLAALLNRLFEFYSDWFTQVAGWTAICCLIPALFVLIALRADTNKAAH